LAVFALNQRRRRQQRRARSRPPNRLRSLPFFLARTTAPSSCCLNLCDPGEPPPAVSRIARLCAPRCSPGPPLLHCRNRPGPLYFSRRTFWESSRLMSTRPRKSLGLSRTRSAPRVRSRAPGSFTTIADWTDSPPGRSVIPAAQGKGPGHQVGPSARARGALGRLTGLRWAHSSEQRRRRSRARRHCPWAASWSRRKGNSGLTRTRYEAGPEATGDSSGQPILSSLV